MWTLEAIKTASKEAGFDWFNRPERRERQTKVYPLVYDGPGGVFFVVSEKYEGTLFYSVMRFSMPHNVITFTAGSSFTTKGRAVEKAKGLAATVHHDGPVPVSP